LAKTPSGRQCATSRFSRHGQLAEEARDLELAANPSTRDLMLFEPRQLDVAEQDRAGARFGLAADESRQVVLPAPFGPMRQRSSPRRTPKLRSLTRESR